MHSRLPLVNREPRKHRGGTEYYYGVRDGRIRGGTPTHRMYCVRSEYSGGIVVVFLLFTVHVGEIFARAVVALAT